MALRDARGARASPGCSSWTTQTYNGLFTIHGTAMMLLFATPMVAAFANYLSRSRSARPTWCSRGSTRCPTGCSCSAGSSSCRGSSSRAARPTSAGRATRRNSTLPYSTTTGTDLWIVGLLLTGVASILGAVNFVVDDLHPRAPGMAMLRLPVFTWSILVTSILILYAFPAITAALVDAARSSGASGRRSSTRRSGGDPILWQHLFWFFGHPEVYIIALPFFGVIGETIPVFSRKPLFGYRAFILPPSSSACTR